MSGSPREERARGPDADRGVRIEQIAGLAPRSADLREHGFLADRLRREIPADARQRLGRDREGARLREARHQAAHGRRIAAMGLEQEALEIGRDLDIHRRRGGRHDAAQLVGAGRQGARQDVVGVGRQHQPPDRQAHALGDPAGEDVAEIAGRHGEGDRAVRPAERHGRREVIDRLRGDARPIDRVDARQLQLVAEARVVEQRLHDGLAIVEGALERDGMHVGRVDAGHLAALHLRHAPVRVEDEHVDLIEPLEGLDGGAAGIARGRADDRRAAAARAQDVVHQLPEQLHGHVLEGEGRAVEQLEHEQVVADLGEGAHGRMAEGGVGLPRSCGRDRRQQCRRRARRARSWRRRRSAGPRKPAIVSRASAGQASGR